MSELKFKLEFREQEAFEGPLDVLLTLIQKHKLNIQDIEISVLLDQFMLYLDRMTEADIDVTADFLEMAARLIMIKSAALLPKEDAERLKRELEGALIEYAMCKTMAERLKTRWVGDCIFVRRPMELETDTAYSRSHMPEELVMAYSVGSARGVRREAYIPKSLKPIVAKSYVTVFTGIISVLRTLKHNGDVGMNDLYKNQPRSKEVATFLAILELSKQGRIVISEDGTRVRLSTLRDKKESESE